MNVTGGAAAVDNSTIELNASSQIAVKQLVGEIDTSAMTPNIFSDTFNVTTNNWALNRWAASLVGTGAINSNTARGTLKTDTGANAGSTALAYQACYFKPTVGTISKIVFRTKCQINGTSDVVDYKAAIIRNNAGTHYAEVKHLSTYTANKGCLVTAAGGAATTSAEFNLANDGTWYDVIIVWSAVDVKCYINGVLVATNVAGVPTLTTEVQVDVGYVGNLAVAASQYIETASASLQVEM